MLHIEMKVLMKDGEIVIPLNKLKDDVKNVSLGENIGEIRDDFFVISPSVSFDDKELFPSLGKVFINPRGVYSIMKKNVPEIIRNMNNSDNENDESLEKDVPSPSPTSLEEKLVEEMIVL